MAKSGAMFECGVPEEARPMDTKIPTITEEDRRNYEWFVAKVAETSFVNSLPVEWFAQVEKLRTFGLPTVDFPPRDNVATFKAIVENVDKEYKAGNPLPLRQFIQDTKATMTASLADGPFATGEKFDGEYGVFIYTPDLRRAIFTVVPFDQYKKLIKHAYKALKEDPEDYVALFWKGDGDYTDVNVVHGSIELEENYLNEGRWTQSIPIMNGAYTFKKIAKLYKQISSESESSGAMQVGKQLMEYRTPVSERRAMEREWARRGRGLASMDMSGENWGEDWARRYQTSGLFDSVKNVITGGVGKVGETRDSIIDRVNRGIRDFNFSLKTGADYDDDEIDLPAAADALCLLVSQHTGVPCEQDAPWPEEVFGPAQMNYQKMLASLQMFLWRHGFDERSGRHQVLRQLIQGDHECESIPLGETKGTKFKGPEFEELGAAFVPNKDMEDGGLFFAKGVPIKISMLVRAGKDGGWVSYLYPLATNTDGSAVYLTHDEAGNVNGVMVNKPSARGRAWTQVWQPRV